MPTETKDFTTISPSAIALIGLKAHTSIPFAKEAATLLIDYLSETYKNHEKIDKAMFFKSLVHFENRYRTVDKALSELHMNNIIEISSGYSFRGLNLCYNRPVHFIDTDLPHVVALKEGIVEKLIETHLECLKGSLKLRPLNAIDEVEFEALADSLPEGPIAIINEGLLVYLNAREKNQLANIIRKILQKRGGYWITGDIYIKKDTLEEALIPNEKAMEFRQFHHIDENKFESFEVAEQFFTENGFIISQRISVAANELSCLDLLGEKKAGVIEKLTNSQPSRETWCLQIKK